MTINYCISYLRKNWHQLKPAIMQYATSNKIQIYLFPIRSYFLQQHNIESIRYCVSLRRDKTFLDLKLNSHYLLYCIIIMWNGCTNVCFVTCIVINFFEPIFVPFYYMYLAFGKPYLIYWLCSRQYSLHCLTRKTRLVSSHARARGSYSWPVAARQLPLIVSRKAAHGLKLSRFEKLSFSSNNNVGKPIT